MISFFSLMVALRTGCESTMPKESTLRKDGCDAFEKRNAYWRTDYLDNTITSLYHSSGLECIWRSCSAWNIWLCCRKQRNAPNYFSIICLSEIEFHLSKLGMTIFCWLSMDSKFYVSLIYLSQKMLPFASLPGECQDWRLRSQRSLLQSLSKWCSLSDISPQWPVAWRDFFALLFENITYVLFSWRLD